MVKEVEPLVWFALFPPTPIKKIDERLLFKWRSCTIRSETSEISEPWSISALVFVFSPLAAVTKTWAVANNTHEHIGFWLIAECKTWVSAGLDSTDKGFSEVDVAELGLLFLKLFFWWIVVCVMLMRAFLTTFSYSAWWSFMWSKTIITKFMLIEHNSYSLLYWFRNILRAMSDIMI